jgi:hypothetical protein
MTCRQVEARNRKNLQDGQWIFEAGKECAAVDVVEWLVVNPGIFCIVDLEAAVLWNVGWLNCGEISANHYC